MRCLPLSEFSDFNKETSEFKSLDYVFYWSKVYQMLENMNKMALLPCQLSDSFGGGIHRSLPEIKVFVFIKQFCIFLFV